MGSSTARARFWRCFDENEDRLRADVYGAEPATRERAMGELGGAVRQAQPGVVLEFDGSAPPWLAGRRTPTWPTSATRRPWPNCRWTNRQQQEPIDAVTPKATPLEGSTDESPAMTSPGAHRVGKVGV